MGIRSCNKDYEVSLILWRQTRAAIEGKGAVLALALDVNGGLSSPFYRVTNDNHQFVTKRKFDFWNRAKYYNCTGMTHKALDGMIWSKPPVAKWSPKMNYLESPTDGQDSIREVAQKTTSEVVGVGRYGILADMADRDVTLADTNNPVMVKYKAEAIFFSRVKAGKLIEVRLLEESEEVGDNGLDYCIKPQVRRLVLVDGVYHNQVWKGNGDNGEFADASREDSLGGSMISDITPIANGSTFPFIPFQFFGADNNSPEIGLIPMFDLGSVNLGHYALDADNRDNLHFHGQGMTNIFVADAAEFEVNNPNGLDVGAKGKNMFGTEDRVEVLQIAATGAIAAEMLRDEARMIGLGSQNVQEGSTNKTLGGQEMEFAASTSTLKQISYNVTDGLNNVLMWLQMFKGITTPISYTLNTDFITDQMDAQQVANHMAMVQQGYLPADTLLGTARRVGFTDLDDEALKTAIDEQMVTPATDEGAATLQAEIDELKEQLALAQGSGE